MSSLLLLLLLLSLLLLLPVVVGICLAVAKSLLLYVHSGRLRLAILLKYPSPFSFAVDGDTCQLERIGFYGMGSLSLLIVCN